MNIETCRNENTLPVTSKDTDYVFTKDGIIFTVPAIYVRFCHIYVGATKESAMQGNKEPSGTKFAGKTVRYNDKPICYINVRLAQSDELDNYNGFHQNYPLSESYLTHRYPYFRVLSDIAYEVTDERHVYIYDKRMSEFDNLIHRSALLRSIYEYANSYSDLSDLAKDFADAVYTRLSLEEKSALNFNRNNYVKEKSDENLLKSAAYDIMCKHMNNEGDFKDLYVDKEFIFKDGRIILNPEPVHIYTKDHHTSEAEETFRPNSDKPTEYLWAHEAQAFRNLRFLYQNHCTVFYLHTQSQRSDNYREEMLKNHINFFEGTVHCAYCGYSYKTKYIQADHIVPVYAVKSDPEKWQKWFDEHGFEKGLNDDKNIAPACIFCNKQKSHQTGSWIKRGLRGKKNQYWLFIAILRFIWSVSFFYFGLKVPNIPIGILMILLSLVWPVKRLVYRLVNYFKFKEFVKQK